VGSQRLVLCHRCSESAAGADGGSLLVERLTFKRSSNETDSPPRHLAEIQHCVATNVGCQVIVEVG
jgi:hypothetical protein